MRIKFRKTAFSILPLFWCLPFVLLAVLFLFYGWEKDFHQYNTTFLTINLTIAVFAINFSFLQYQFSPYRALLQQIPKTQISAAVIIFTLALLPFVCLVFNVVGCRIYLWLLFH